MEFDVAQMCGVSVLELGSVPEFRQAQAVVILQARRVAAARLSKEAKTYIPPEFFIGA